MSFLKKYLKYKEKSIDFSQHGGVSEGDTISDMKGNKLGTIVIIEQADDEIIYMSSMGKMNQVLISDENKTWKVISTVEVDAGGGGGARAPPAPIAGVSIGNVISDMQDKILGTVTIIDNENDEIIYMSLDGKNIGQVLISNYNKSWKLLTAAKPKPLPYGLAPPPGLGHAPPPGLGHAPPPGLGQAPPPGLGQAPPPGLGQAPQQHRRIINLTYPFNNGEIVGESQNTYTVRFSNSNTIVVFYKNREGFDWKFE